MFPRLWITPRLCLEWRMLRVIVTRVHLREQAKSLRKSKSTISTESLWRPALPERTNLFSEQPAKKLDLTSIFLRWLTFESTAPGFTRRKRRRRHRKPKTLCGWLSQKPVYSHRKKRRKSLSLQPLLSPAQASQAWKPLSVWHIKGSKFTLWKKKLKSAACCESLTSSTPPMKTHLRSWNQRFEL